VEALLGCRRFANGTADASRSLVMLYLVFGHTAEEPALRMGPMPAFKVRGDEIVDHTGAVLARHNGHRWTVNERHFYRIDCAGPVVVGLEIEAGHAGTATRGPFEHFSLFNGTAYASREVFAHYDEQDAAWHLHKSDQCSSTLLIRPA
jgi:hypothetical protein